MHADYIPRVGTCTHTGDELPEVAVPSFIICCYPNKVDADDIDRLEELEKERGGEYF